MLMLMLMLMFTFSLFFFSVFFFSSNFFPPPRRLLLPRRTRRRTRDVMATITTTIATIMINRVVLIVSPTTMRLFPSQDLSQHLFRGLLVQRRVVLPAASVLRTRRAASRIPRARAVLQQPQRPSQ